MSEPLATVTRLNTPLLLELDERHTKRWIQAIGALKLAGFRVESTPHSKRLRIVDDVRPVPPVRTK